MNKSKISPEPKLRTEAPLLIVITGPSGTGKSTLIHGLLAADPRLSLSVSHTTRPPRPQETDGQDYHFVDDAHFDAMVADGAFAEWAHVHTRRYGTSREEISRLQGRGLDPIFDIDVIGAGNLAKSYPECVRIFILPPSLATLEQRLRHRGTEEEAMIQTRLNNAKREIEAADTFDYFVINDVLDEARLTLQAIIRSERQRATRLPNLTQQLLQGKALS